jgi:hypothetical protein
VTSELLARIESALAEWRRRSAGRSVVADAQTVAQLANRTVPAGR